MKIIEDYNKIIIEITNTSTDTLENFNIFDYPSKNKDISIEIGNFGRVIKNKDISIEIGNFGFTFEQLKDYLKQNSITIYETHILSFHSSQLFELCQSKHKNKTTNIMPIIEKYTHNCIIKYEHLPYILGIESTFVIKKLLSNTSLKIYLKKTKTK